MSARMTIHRANEIVGDFFYDIRTDEKSEFKAIEALTWLVRHGKNSSSDAFYLAEYYLRNDVYEVAEKYYLLSIERGDTMSANNLGLLYRNGMVGDGSDYKKAFKYLKMASENGEIFGDINLAQMYEKGMYVKKDEAKAREIIEKCWERVKDEPYNINSAFLDVAYYYAQIKARDGDKIGAAELFAISRDALANRLACNGEFFNEIRYMRRTVLELNEVAPIGVDCLTFYDLFLFEDKNCTAYFRFGSRQFQIKIDNRQSKVLTLSEICEKETNEELETQFFHNFTDLVGEGKLDDETPIISIGNAIHNVEIKYD